MRLFGTNQPHDFIPIKRLFYQKIWRALYPFHPGVNSFGRMVHSDCVFLFAGRPSNQNPGAAVLMVIHPSYLVGG